MWDIHIWNYTCFIFFLKYFVTLRCGKYIWEYGISVHLPISTALYKWNIFILFISVLRNFFARYVKETHINTAWHVYHVATALSSHICSKWRFIFSHNNSDKLNDFLCCKSRNTTANYRFFLWDLVSKTGITPSPLQVDFPSFRGKGTKNFLSAAEFGCREFSVLEKMQATARKLTQEIDSEKWFLWSGGGGADLVILIITGKSHPPWGPKKEKPVLFGAK